ncbi:MAG: hypothetical protein WCI51_10170 [Lentisphaerota bacterium]
MNAQEFQENFDKALLYKKESRLADSLKLHHELYAQLLQDASDYAKCVDSSGTDDYGIIIDTEQFYNNADEYLRSDNQACILLNNICVILTEAGKKEAAREFFIESVKYLPAVENTFNHEMWMEK